MMITMTGDYVIIGVMIIAIKILICDGDFWTITMHSIRDSNNWNH